MSILDVKQYQMTVLKEWSKSSEKRRLLDEVISQIKSNPDAYLQLPLAELFFIPDHPNRQDLTSLGKALRSALNRYSRDNLFVAASRLLDILKLLQEQGLWEEPEFWEMAHTSRSSQLERLMDKLVQDIVKGFPLGVITESNAKKLLHGVGATDSSVSQLSESLKKHKIQIVDDFEFEEHTVDLSVSTSWKNAQNFAEFKSILSVVLYYKIDSLKNVQIFDKFVVSGQKITCDDLQKSKNHSESAKDDNAVQAVQKVLSSLISTCAENDEKLHEIVLQLLYEQTVQLLREKPLQIAIRDELVKAGLDAIEAARLISIAEANGTSVLAVPKISIDKVLTTLADGKLAEAETLLSALSSTSDDAEKLDELKKRIENQKIRKRQLVQEYNDALNNRNFDMARDSIREAIAIDRDDEILVHELDAIPPNPVRELMINTTEKGVQLRWDNKHHQGEKVSYRVVRSTTGNVLSPFDGTVLATDLVSNKYLDQDLLVGKQIYYGIFATRDGKQFSNPVSRCVEILLPPVKIETIPGNSSILISWQLPKAAHGTSLKIIQYDGTNETKVFPVSIKSYEAKDLARGTLYQFQLRAMYLLNGQTAYSPEVEVSGIPCESVQPICDFSFNGEENGFYTVTWSGNKGLPIEIWIFPENPNFTEGETVTQAQLCSRKGNQINCVIMNDQNKNFSTAKIQAFQGMRIAVPLTIYGQNYLVGNSIVLGSENKISDIHLDRLVDSVRLSWVWPVDNTLVIAKWNDDQGRLRNRRITKMRYKADGGLVVTGSKITEISLTTISILGENELESSPIVVQIAKKLPRISYHLSIKKILFSKVVLIVTANTDTPGIKFPVDVVYSNGKYMPGIATEGKLLTTILLDFTSVAEYSEKIELNKLLSPYWIRLFPSNTELGQLIDPPTREMKG